MRIGASGYGVVPLVVTTDSLSENTFAAKRASYSSVNIPPSKRAVNALRVQVGGRWIA